jgi:ACS family sodium-dependent inorganic phosphate cotransporter-like MFS transporter 5
MASNEKENVADGLLNGVTVDVKADGDKRPSLERSNSLAAKIPFPSCRYILVAMGCFAFINVYTLRVNLSVAIVEMVNTTYLRELEAQAVIDNNETAKPHANECPIGLNETRGPPEESTGQFNWDSQQQGIVLAAFFYGYITTQILGGVMAQRVGGKFLLLGGIFWTALLTLLTPPLTTAGGFAAIVAVRVLEGIGEGITYPSMNAMLAKWAPPLERSIMATFIFAGAQAGTVIGMPVSGFLCKWLGWESVFYVFGVIGVIWAVMWFFLTYNTPAKHPRISTAEREYIESKLGKKEKSSMHVPWLCLAKSLPLYALAISHFTCNWGYYTLLTCLPQYFKHILHFDIKSNGLVSGAPYLAMWIIIMISGYIADQLRTRKIMSTTNVRKLFNGIGFICPATCLVATGYVNCNAPLAVFLIIAAVGTAGISFAGWSVNHLDLAPPYAGTLMGITNTLATMPGFIGPSVVGAITYRNHTAEAWRKVFYIAAGVYGFGTLFYALFGSGEKQPWADVAQQPAQPAEEELKNVEKRTGGEEDDKKTKI